MPEEVSSLCFLLFPPVSRADTDHAIFTSYWPQRGPPVGGCTSDLPQSLAPLKAHVEYSHQPQLGAWCLWDDAVRSAGLRPTYSSKQKWAGPWPLLSSSVLLSSSLTSPWSKSTTHGRKRKGTSFPSILPIDPFAGPRGEPEGRCESRRGGRGTRQSRAPVTTGAAGPLGTFFTPSLPPLEERPITAACILQPYYNLCA